MELTSAEGTATRAVLYVVPQTLAGPSKLSGWTLLKEKYNDGEVSV